MSKIFYSKNEKYLKNAIGEKLSKALRGIVPIIVCVGTDAVIGDSFAPIVGTILKQKRPDLFVYGSLDKTITAKDVKAVCSFLSGVHKADKILVIDAAVGEKDDVGKIKIESGAIRPGLGANKSLPALGDVSLIYVIGERSDKRLFAERSVVRLSDIYDAAKAVAESVISYVDSISKKTAGLSVSL